MLNRAKEEAAERKKAEDKGRRDQIFQEYLKRKEQREEEEQLARAGRKFYYNNELSWLFKLNCPSRYEYFRMTTLRIIYT